MAGGPPLAHWYFWFNALGCVLVEARPATKPDFIQKGRNFEANFRYTNFFLASDPPPGVRCPPH